MKLSHRQLKQLIESTVRKTLLEQTEDDGDEFTETMLRYIPGLVDIGDDPEQAAVDAFEMLLRMEEEDASFKNPWFEDYNDRFTRDLIETVREAGLIDYSDYNTRGGSEVGEPGYFPTAKGHRLTYLLRKLP